jgi:hypothetical protein
MMTNEEIIEEILIDAHSYGFRIEVLVTARKILDENPKMDRVSAYEEAYNEWIK